MVFRPRPRSFGLGHDRPRLGRSLSQPRPRKRSPSFWEPTVIPGRLLVNPPPTPRPSWGGMAFGTLGGVFLALAGTAGAALLGFLVLRHLCRARALRALSPPAQNSTPIHQSLSEKGHPRPGRPHSRAHPTFPSHALRRNESPNVHHRHGNRFFPIRFPIGHGPPRRSRRLARQQHVQTRPKPKPETNAFCSSELWPQP